jgi:hypothetical protein
MSQLNIPVITPMISKTILKKYNTNIILAPKNIKTVKHLHTNTKQKINKEYKSQLVYRIKCSCNTHYTGIVHKQHLATRLKQHSKNCERILNLSSKLKFENHNNIKKSATLKLNQHQILQEENPSLKIDPNILKLIKACETSGLTSHFADYGHEFDFEGTRIIDKNNNRFKLGIMEMIHIKMDPGVNKMTDTQNLNPSYYGLIDKINNYNGKQNSRDKKVPISQTIAHDNTV